VSLSGSGFYEGGTASAVQSVYLDNSAGTTLAGYTVSSDQTITGAVIPSGLAPGVYHIKVQTAAGTSVNEPTYTVEPANAIHVSTLGYSAGPNLAGTNFPVQRHLARTANGTLVAVYIGPANGETQYPSYNFSLDGGHTWSGQGQLFLSNQGTVIYAPATSIWADASGQIDISSVQWPSYNETIQKFAMNSLGVLTQDTGFPVYPSGGTAQTALLTPGIASSLVTEPGGRLWVVYEQGSAGGTGPVLAYYSDNGGISWTSTAPINQAPGTEPAVVVYQGYPAVLYSDGGSLAWATWNGQSWSGPQILPGPITGVGLSLSATVTSNGQVGVAYSGTSGGVSYCTFTGESWSAPAVLDPAGSSPSLTTDGTNFYVFYTNASGNLVYRQTANGVWSVPAAVTADGNQNTAASTLPVSPAGQIPVIWTSGSAATGYLVKATLIGNQEARQLLRQPRRLRQRRFRRSDYRHGELQALFQPGAPAALLPIHPRRTSRLSQPRAPSA